MSVINPLIRWRTLVCIAFCACVLTLCGVVAPSSGKAKDLLDRFKPIAGGTVDKNGIYRLSREEIGFDCDQLSGRMQLRILQIRDKRPPIENFNIFTISYDWLLDTVGIGSETPEEKAYRFDLALLEAYNRRLAEKKCPIYDLASELVPKPVHVTPEPVRELPQNR